MQNIQQDFVLHAFKSDGDFLTSFTNSDILDIWISIQVCTQTFEKGMRI